MKNEDGSAFDHPKTRAAGTPAVVEALKQVFGKAGVVRGTEALLRLNQVGGFDCPSCAWPDPDGHRSVAEFCENGAKAVASEAMDHTIGREFFAAHSVADLRAQTDAWHDLQGRIAEPMLLREGGTHYEPVAWEDAFAILAEELRGSLHHMRRPSTPPAAPAMKRLFSISSSSAPTGRTTCPTAPTCATSPAGSR